MVCESAPPENQQSSIGAAPRPFERRPVPAGRNFGWWRQPERLFERPQGASCAEGSDQSKFQAGVTGRPFGPLLTFRLVGTRGKVSDAGIVFQKWKQSYVSITYGLDLWGRPRFVGPPPHEVKLFLRDVGPHRMGNTFTSWCGPAAK